MVKKMKPAESTADNSSGGGKYSALLDSQLASSVKESAQQIWLAGMGAFAKAQAEGGKVFEALVKEGSKLQKKTQGLAEDKIGEVTGKMSAMADTVSAKAGQNWDKLEAIFEQRTAKAMHKLGVPTAKDVDALVKRVDELAAAMAKMGKTGKTTTSGTTRSAKPAAKPTATAHAAPAKRTRKTSAA